MMFAPGTPDSVMRKAMEDFQNRGADKVPMSTATQRRLNRLNASENLSPAQRRTADHLNARLGSIAAPANAGNAPLPSMPSPGSTPPSRISSPPAKSQANASMGSAPMGSAPMASRPAATGMTPPAGGGMRRGGKVEKTSFGGATSKVSSASKRGDGIAKKGKTKGRYI